MDFTVDAIVEDIVVSNLVVPHCRLPEPLRCDHSNILVQEGVVKVKPIGFHTRFFHPALAAAWIHNFEHEVSPKFN
jgi:hypothetical protein